MSKFKVGDWVEKTSLPAEKYFITYIAEVSIKGSYKLAYASGYPKAIMDLGHARWYDSELRLLSGRQTVLDV